MRSPESTMARVHLRAAGLALALAVLGVVAWWGHARAMEQRHLPEWVAENSPVKDLGMAWQRETFGEPNVLPLYASSELIKKAPNKANLFFAESPSGFTVSPVGRASCTSLILLEKLAASAGEARGHKVAICVSPSWFLDRGANHAGFGGNFSTVQASELFFTAPLSLPLKQAIARQMLRYPEVFAKSPVLDFAVHAAAGERWMDRALYFASLPLGRLQNAVYRLQDHFEVLDHLRNEHRLRHGPMHLTTPLNWEALLAETKGQVPPLPEEVHDDRAHRFAGDGAFLQALQRSYEWTDLDLLLRVTRELHLDPLLLSMPIEYAHFERMGIAPQTIDAYAWRLRDFAQRYEVPVVDFADLGEDAEFFADHYGHPSAKGWLYLNRALDDFYHGRAAADLLPEAPSNPLTDRPRPLRSAPWSAIPGT